MVTERPLHDVIDAIAKLRALGATRVCVGDVEVSFGASTDAPAPEVETDEQRRERLKREREDVLFHSAAG